MRQNSQVVAVSSVSDEHERPISEFSPSPVALFVYNRPEHTRATVEALLKNPLAGESDLHIFSDAAKRPEVVRLVEEVRAYIKTIEGFRTVNVVEQEHNQGLANSIMAGVSLLCGQYGQVIVVEDDLVVAPGFLAYLNSALQRYRNQPAVMQISAHMFPVDFETDAEAFFLPFTTSWGWATWSRAWAFFDPQASGYEALLKSKALRKKFDLDGSYPYWRMLQSQLHGKIDSWAIRWYLSVFQKNGLTLFPKQTFVNNIGFDGSGVHCGASQQEQMQLNSERVDFWPEVVSVKTAHREAVYAYLRKQNTRGVRRLINGLLGRIRAKRLFG